MYYNISDLKKGSKIEINNIPWLVVDIVFHKPGKGQAVYRCKIKSLFNKVIIDKVYRSSEKILKAEIEEKHVYFLYKLKETYIFNDSIDYEELYVGKDILGIFAYFLVENMLCTIVKFKNKIIEVKLPIFVEKKVIKTSPFIKGNTVNSTFKIAIIEGGYELSIPSFIKNDDIIKIDTRTKKYVERVKN